MFSNVLRQESFVRTRSKQMILAERGEEKGMVIAEQAGLNIFVA